MTRGERGGRDFSLWLLDSQIWLAEQILSLKKNDFIKMHFFRDYFLYDIMMIGDMDEIDD